jgi:hypothetical protein
MGSEDKPKKKWFLARLVERLDKKMQECAKSKSCCSANNDSKDKSCCSK